MHLLQIRGHELLKGHVAGAGVLHLQPSDDGQWRRARAKRHEITGTHLRTDGQRAVGGAQGPSNEAGLVRLQSCYVIARAAGNPRGLLHTRNTHHEPSEMSETWQVGVHAPS